MFIADKNRFRGGTFHNFGFGESKRRWSKAVAKREAGASELLRDRGVGRAVAGVIGTIFLEQTNSAYAEFVWIPGCVLSR